MSEANGNQLPPGWAEVSIEDLFWPMEDGRTLHQGWSPQCDKFPARTHVDWGVLKTTAIQAGAFLPEHNKNLPKHLTPRPQIEVKNGDILITCAGPRVRCGVACLVRNTRPHLMMSGKMYRFRVPFDRMDARFLEAFLLTPDAIAAIDRMKTGGSDSGLNLTHERFRQLPATVAPLKEQRRIVDAIDSHVTRLDDAVASLERVQAKLKAYRASVLKAAVEGRLVPTEASLARAEKRDYEPADVLLARILKERRRHWDETELGRLKAAGKTPKDDKWQAKYQEPVALDTGTHPQLPEGWCWASVDQLTDGARNSGYGVLVPGPDVTDGVPLVRVGDIHDGTVSTGELKRIDRVIADQFAKTYLSGGEVLLSLVGTIGRSAVVPHSLSGANVARAVGVIPTSSLVRSRWVEIWFRSPRVRALMNSRAHEVARKTLNLEDVRAAAVAVPPVSEQDRIIAEAEDLESIAAAIASTVVANSVRCSRLRQAVLRWAFEGKLVDQDPSDEPAEKLLDRIRAERAIVAPTKRGRGRAANGAA